VLRARGTQNMPVPWLVKFSPKNVVLSTTSVRLDGTVTSARELPVSFHLEFLPPLMGMVWSRGVWGHLAVPAVVFCYVKSTNLQESHYNIGTFMSYGHDDHTSAR
jgi:hypothetical protein